METTNKPQFTLSPETQGYILLYKKFNALLAEISDFHDSQLSKFQCSAYESKKSDDFYGILADKADGFQSWLYSLITDNIAQNIQFVDATEL